MFFKAMLYSRGIFELYYVKGLCKNTHPVMEIIANPTVVEEPDDKKYIGGRTWPFFRKRF
jgi:hypothetical protein